MHAMLCCTGCRTAKQISRNDQICICTTDTSRRFRSDTAWTHVTDTAASTAQSKTALWLLFVKTVKCRIISKLLHTQHHFFDCRVRHIVQHILLCRKCFAISCNRLHVIFRENFLVAVFILISIFIYMFVCMSADRHQNFRNTVFVESNDRSVIMRFNLRIDHILFVFLFFIVHTCFPFLFFENLSLCFFLKVFFIFWLLYHLILIMSIGFIYIENIEIIPLSSCICRISENDNLSQYKKPGRFSSAGLFISHQADI